MRRAARTDNTAKALRAYAESLGFVVAHIGGVIDCLLVFGLTTIPVDWKSKGGTLTPDQAKWVARGVPIRFISTPAQLDALRDEMRHRELIAGNKRSETNGRSEDAGLCVGDADK